MNQNKNEKYPFVSIARRMKQSQKIEGMDFLHFFPSTNRWQTISFPMHLQLNKHAYFSKKIVKSFPTPKHLL
jgi:hypothetical protein